MVGEFSQLYADMVDLGRRTAASQRAYIVGLARDCADNLPNTLELLAELADGFAGASAFFFENDSADETGEILEQAASATGWIQVERASNGRLKRGNEFAGPRTEALAEYRNKCLGVVSQSSERPGYVIVCDMDADRGFSVDGVFNSVGWLAHKSTEPAVLRPGGMGSYSLLQQGDQFAHYDAFAARLNWWDRRGTEVDHNWFHLLFPPVGSPPIPMNSCFGGLAVYDAAAYLSSRYSGEDCEHVCFHRRMRKAGYQMFLNPGSRFAAIFA